MIRCTYKICKIREGTERELRGNCTCLLLGTKEEIRDGSDSNFTYKEQHLRYWIHVPSTVRATAQFDRLQ